MVGIAQACISDPDDRLLRLLNDAIGDAEAFIGVGVGAPVAAPAVVQAERGERLVPVS